MLENLSNVDFNHIYTGDFLNPFFQTSKQAITWKTSYRPTVFKKSSRKSNPEWSKVSDFKYIQKGMLFALSNYTSNILIYFQDFTMCK